MPDQTGNLPDWPGADTVYKRLYSVMRVKGRREYEAFTAVRRSKRDRFTPSDDLLHLTRICAEGDEEAMKAAVWLYRDLLIEGERREAAMAA